MNTNRRRKRFAGLVLGAAVLTSVAATGAGPVATGQGPAPAQVKEIGRERLGSAASPDVLITVNAERDPKAFRRATVRLKTVIRDPDGSQRQLETTVGRESDWFFDVVTAPKGLGELRASNALIRPDSPERRPVIELKVRLTPNQGYQEFTYEAKGGQLVQTGGPHH